MRLPVGPNAVTLMSLIRELIAAAHFWSGHAPSVALGLLFYFLQAVADHADGELARRTGRVSRLGARLDVGADTVTAVLIFVGLALTAHPNGALRIVLALLVGSGVALASLGVNLFPPRGTGSALRTTERLGNRDPVYVVLIAFVLLLWTAPALLPPLVWVLAVGPHVYWLVHVIPRTGGRRH